MFANACCFCRLFISTLIWEFISLQHWIYLIVLLLLAVFKPSSLQMPVGRRTITAMIASANLSEYACSMRSLCMRNYPLHQGVLLVEMCCMAALITAQNSYLNGLASLFFFFPYQHHHCWSSLEHSCSDPQCLCLLCSLLPLHGRAVNQFEQSWHTS